MIRRWRGSIQMIGNLSRLHVPIPERPPILQAVDSQWWDFRDALREKGVTVEFICEDDIKRLREDTLGFFFKMCIFNNGNGIIYAQTKKVFIINQFLCIYKHNYNPLEINNEY